ncbi:FecCD family ABC transporter permease [Treponema pedis]|uniref:Iron compound ABC transporter permease n=1 Tax=Treponema pedis str. T A4 TaxID=1291379 RepID=S6A465_9SPIR|nr:iron ABC transporter permease [Treponema pedis]AGT44131.1 iron compound ABC transporter permease [Treponema pedis str. T A4]QSI04848.1 iron ABC transporter permease [Treponema pedis]
MKKIFVFTVLTLILALLFFSSVAFGSIKFSFRQITEALIGRGESLVTDIIFDLRLPRIFTALIVGMNLAVSGALLQAVMQNPLADPGIIGVSAGASVSGIVLMLALPRYAYLVPPAAFCGSMFAAFLIYILAWKDGFTPVRIILAGVAVNALLGSLAGLISILFSDRLQGALMWLNGSLASKSWPHLKVLLIYSIPALILALFCIRPANILLLGDEKAASLGSNVNRSRFFLSVIAAFLAGVSTSTVGIIGFVGLVIPHILRMLVGSDYKSLLPFSMFAGAVLLLGADTFARTIAAPIELPVGIVMAVLGSPFFLYLLRNSSKKY